MAFTRPKAAQIDFDITNISDPLIRLNSGETGSADKDVGIVIERGSDTNAAFLYDESADEFVLVNTAETGTTSGNVTISSYAGLQANAIVYGSLNDGTTTLTSTVAELNHLDGVTGITLGTAGNILIVDSDGTGIASDTSLTIDTANNRLGINQTTPEVTLHMTGDGAQSSQIRIEQHNDTADAPDIRTRKSRGTAASSTNNSAGDYLFRINAESYESGTYNTKGSIQIDTSSADVNKSVMQIQTHDGSSLATRLQILDTGAIRFNSAYTFPTSDGSANQFLQTDGSGALSFASVTSSFTLAADSGTSDSFSTGGTLTFEGGTGVDTTVSNDQISIAIDGTVTTLTGTQTLTNKTLTSPTINNPTFGGVLALTSTSTTVSPLTLNAASLQDNVGSLRINSSEPDIFLNQAASGFTTVTFARTISSNAQPMVGFGKNSNDDIYIFRETAQDVATTTVYDNTSFVLARATGNITMAHDLAVTGDIQYGTLNDGTTELTSTIAELNLIDGSSAGTIVNSKSVIYGSSGEVNATTLQIAGTSITSTATELNYVDGVTSAIQTQLDAKAPLAAPAFTGTATGVNLTLSGDLTVNGTTTTVASTNTVISDNLIELNNGASSNANDSGIVIERGSTGDNAFIGWDESADKFIVGTTTATGASTGDLTITSGTLVADLEGDVTGDVTGNADTATALATARNIAGNSFDGSGDITIASTDLSDTSNLVRNNQNNTITSTTAGGSAGPEFELFRDITGADSNYIGQIKFSADNDADQKTVFAKITGKIGDASDGSEDGIIEIAHQKAGSQNIGIRITSTEFKILNGMDFDVETHDGSSTGLRLANTLVTATAAELNYVDGVTSAIQTQLDAKLALAGGTMSGAIAMGTSKITGMGDPTSAQDAATKAYVDSEIAGSSGDSVFSSDADFAAVTDSVVTSEDLGNVADSHTTAHDLGTITVQGIVVTGSIIDGNVTSAKLADDAVTTAKIADDAVTSVKLSGLTNSSSGVVSADGDGTFSVSAGGGISNIVEDTTPQLGGDLASNGNNIAMADNDEIRVGSGNDIVIKWDATDGHITALGTLNIDGADGHEMAKFIDGGAVELYHNDVKKVETTSGGLSVTGNILPEANGTRDLGSTSLRWQNIYTSDLNLNNGVGNYTVVEGEEDLFLYNNKSGKVFKFALIEVDPSEATPKIEDLRKNNGN